VPSVIGWQIDPVRLVVRRDQEAQAVENVMFTQVLFIDTKHVGWGGGVDLGVIIEAEAIHLAEIASLVDSQDH
jgi:hypothetical protein